jgi:hypothetical protein
MGIVDDDMDAMGGRGWARQGPGPGPRPALVRFGAIGEAWSLLLQRWPTWVLTVLIVLIGDSLASGLIYSVFRVRRVGGPGAFWIGLSPEGQALQYVVSTIVTAFFLGGMFRMACRQIRGQDIGVATLFSVVGVLPQLVLASFLYGLAVFLGFCILVIPGFIISGLLMFTLPLIVDGGLDPMAALTQSWHALKRQWLVAAAFHVVAGFAAAMGLCFCGVGFLLTAPLYCMAISVLYRDFFMVKGHGEPGKAAYPGVS